MLLQNWKIKNHILYRMHMEIKNFERLSAVCEILNSFEDASSVLKHAVDSAPGFEGIDSAGIYILDSSCGDYVLEFSAGLPGWFIDSCSRSQPGSALHAMLEGNGNVFPDSPEKSPFNSDGSPQVFPKGLFPLIPGETASSVLFIASSVPGVLSQEIQRISIRLFSEHRTVCWF